MINSYQVILLPEAEADLQDIYDYIADDNPIAAGKVDRLVATAESLRQLSRRYRVRLSRKSPDRVVHSVPNPPYILNYRVLEKSAVVEVMTIRHGARRQPKRFKP
jgi:plasmid stabilization system protein ParE